MPLTRTQHFDRSIAPKRILSLDGGGLRGVLTLEFLGEIEALLKKRAGREDFRLCDYFDLIGGTSTGSIIAAGLACGMTVDELKTLYRDLGASVFVSTPFRVPLLAAKFPSKRVQDALDQHLGADVTLDSERIRTALMIMTKRLDTGSPWPLHNHPNAIYAAQDGKLLLSHVVRASTAAPTYFDPEILNIATRDGRVIQGAFVDGGVSPFNDPALQLLLVATLQGHGFHWQSGADKILLVSVGTGMYSEPSTVQQLEGLPAAAVGLRALQSLMDDCLVTNHMLLQWLTVCLTPWQIDRVVGDQALDSASGPRLATYARYNVQLDASWIKAKLAMDLTPERLAELAKMDQPANMDALSKIGNVAAKRQVAESHFPARFDAGI
ncbi:MAG TPA: patatin-like phospholipase family protein [Pararobbsia sp.]|nr:patatin-like phospholipase family protein [Pararobbsia sp.]